MQEPKQQALERSEREHRFRFHITSAKEAFEEARQDGLPLTFTRCLSHAKVALSVAKKANRPDLEQNAQLAIVDFLEMAGRKREAMEARIIVAATMDNLKVKYESLTGTYESGARLASVDGIPIDQVIQLLEDDGYEQQASSSDQKQIPAAADPHRSNECESSAICEPQNAEPLPKAVLEGRQIRDLHGRLVTVLAKAPRLRRKPNFNK